jgi:hypothetical protein
MSVSAVWSPFLTQRSKRGAKTQRSELYKSMENYEEDVALINKIEEREKENNPLISHEEYWDIEDSSMAKTSPAQFSIF